MYPFIETIKCQDGEVFYLKWHQQRVEETLKKHFANASIWSLENLIRQQEIPLKGCFKIRVLYGETSQKISIEPYLPRVIKTLDFVETKAHYPFKYTNRTFICEALALSKADEVIFCKDGYILDSSYANVVFFDGEEWFTPHTFLLNGTTRQRLLKEHKIRERAIKKEDVMQFQKIGFINAMNTLGEQTITLNNL